MATWQVILIIALVLGVVWSNIALLKYSTKFDYSALKKQQQDKDAESSKDEDEPPQSSK